MIAVNYIGIQMSRKHIFHKSIFTYLFVGKTRTLLLLFSSTLFFSACGDYYSKPNDRESIKTQFYTRAYKLTFDPSFSRVLNVNESVSFRVIYPEMLPFSKKLKDRFYSTIGTIGTDRVDIRLTEYRAIPVIENSVKASINDRGRFIKERRFLFDKNMTKAELSPKDPVNVYKYKSLNYGDDQAFYFFEDKNKKMTSISCIITPLCNATTTWQGKISISYRFNAVHLINIRDLDNKIHNLLNSFNPKKITSDIYF